VDYSLRIWRLSHNAVPWLSRPSHSFLFGFFVGSLLLFFFHVNAVMVEGSREFPILVMSPSGSVFVFSFYVQIFFYVSFSSPSILLAGCLISLGCEPSGELDCCPWSLAPSQWSRSASPISNVVDINTRISIASSWDNPQSLHNLIYTIFHLHYSYLIL